MNSPLALADTLHRTAKIALDTGEAHSAEEALRIFSRYKVHLAYDGTAAADPATQAALLTAVNCAARTFLGGVTFSGPACLTLLGGYFGRDLAEVLSTLGGVRSPNAPDHVPTIAFGSAMPERRCTIGVRAVATGWSAGVIRLDSSFPEIVGTILAGVLAGALAISEVFQHLRGDAPFAARRAIGLNLWDPEADWLASGDAPRIERLPKSVWLVGLGNLGQAYLWTLGLLPYEKDQVEFVLQDEDFLAPSNESTSLLTFGSAIGRRKTRAMADWAEARGFRTSIVERAFGRHSRVSNADPSVVLMGVDNGLTRQAAEDAGFARVIDVGLGRGPKDFLGIDLRTFPASLTARDVWADAAQAEADLALPAYRALIEESGDRCGTVGLAGRSIGAPFVGAVGAALAVTELLRIVHGAPRIERLSLHLRDLRSRTVFRGDALDPHNPGAIRLGH